MSDIIRLLPDSVANQIAAGEVIQRPASVLKELVENSIDAGAKEVHILITDAGRTCIQVIDDGKGMSETDARISFERHATSKIRDAADLFALTTMGFRGEALASIAAVAQVDLKTRLENEELGTIISVAGSKVERQETISCPKGSNFSVKNLFFNVPARRKFLKSNQTELSNILSEFERIVLVHPEVAFTLHSNDVELFHLPVSSLRQRVINVFGKKLNQQLLNVDVNTSLIKVTGYVGKPDSARKKGAHQYFFVNGRYMRHPYFHRAVMEAYEKLVPVGEQISYFLYLDVDPADIDVNIHPTKTEIKFENEVPIWQILAASVKESLGKFNEVPSIDFDTEGMPDIPAYNAAAPIQPPKLNFNPNFNPFQKTASNYSRPQVEWESLYGGVEKAEQRSEPDYEPEVIDYPAFQDEEIEPEQTTLYDHETVAEKSSVQFQFKGRFILTSVKSGLMVIDQHRAHIRVLFDQYLQQIKNHQGVSQGVLFPEILELPASEAVVLQEISDDLAAIGFDLSNLGGGSYAINGVPSGIEGLSPVQLIRNMLHTAMEKGCDVKEEVQETLALTLSKAAAIVYGQVLGNDEMTKLVDSLFACATPNYTPDGKTVLSLLKEEDIEKLFK
nr:DNA mismatch repair endonuclease MutL [uncultured Bacteroides sp.]